MEGIDLNKPIAFVHSSLRFFEENESHIDRFCTDDVLLLVYEGVLRFTEDGVPYKVGPGHYHIQKHNTAQTGALPSDAPKYLYVHFKAEWADHAYTLPFQGSFQYPLLKPLIEKMDHYAYGSFTYTERLAVFTEILSLLYQSQGTESVAHRIGKFLESHYSESVCLEELCAVFHFSKNHIINLFREQYGQTPIEYLNSVKLQKAKRFLEVTSKSTEEISLCCGFHSYSHFYRLFLRETGLSPAQWRRQKRISP